MKVIDVHDRLEPLGIFVGAALVLVAVGLLAATPWATNDSVVVSVIQLLGIAATMALGVGLARLSYVRE